MLDAAQGLGVEYLLTIVQLIEHASLVFPGAKYR